MIQLPDISVTCYALEYILNEVENTFLIRKKKPKQQIYQFLYLLLRFSEVVVPGSGSMNSQEETLLSEIRGKRLGCVDWWQGKSSWGGLEEGKSREFIR